MTPKVHPPQALADRLASFAKVTAYTPDAFITHGSFAGKDGDRRIAVFQIDAAPLGEQGRIYGESVWELQISVAAEDFAVCHDIADEIEQGLEEAWKDDLWLYTVELPDTRREEVGPQVIIPVLLIRQ